MGSHGKTAQHRHHRKRGDKVSWKRNLRSPRRKKQKGVVATWETAINQETGSTTFRRCRAGAAWRGGGSGRTPGGRKKKKIVFEKNPDNGTNMGGG